MLAASHHRMERRRLPVGAEVIPGEGIHFRVWAPAHDRVELVLEEDGATRRRRVPLERARNGYFERLVGDARAGTRYRFALGADEKLYPDPASRFQPEGPHGPSEVIDPDRWAWKHTSFAGPPDRQVLYEMHVGTFTRAGTYAAAAVELPRLADLGVTTIELMPVAEFSGAFGWGYDGVDLFAPYHGYGRPDDLRAFVDAAHGHGLAVLLDVVYNHLGPDGNYLPAFSPAYFTKRHDTEWGQAINFDGDDAGPVRDLFTANAAYWIREFRFDGLRFDATQCIYDDSKEHVLAVMTRRARAVAGNRRVFFVAENEPQHAEIARPVEEGGQGIDALWNDDFHHTARVAATGRREAYYTDYVGRAQELLSAVKWGYLYQGQRYQWQKKRRGHRALDLPARAFVAYLQNHDQVANSASGARLDRLTSPGRLRALTALLLLMPATPMLFQGQEWGASAPFLYFADHRPELAALVKKGRAEFLRQFPSVASPQVQERLHDPADGAAFERCKLDSSERTRGAHGQLYELHRDLLQLRKTDPVIARADARRLDGAVLSEDAFVVRFFSDGSDDDRLLIVDLGRDLALTPAPEPLLAPPDDRGWRTIWSSEDPRYGGFGVPPLETDGAWTIPGHAAFLLGPGSTPEPQSRRGERTGTGGVA